MNNVFDFAAHGVNFGDCEIARSYIHDLRCPADLVIAPDGAPYIYRWHVVERNKLANVYFHIQIADDPERPLHDHPWDNMSVILSGGYVELLKCDPARDPQQRIERRKGDVVFRRASWAHRLLMLNDYSYTMTQFTTGPKVRDWGFWYPDGFRKADDQVEVVSGRSIQRGPQGDPDIQRRPALLS